MPATITPLQKPKQASRNLTQEIEYEIEAENVRQAAKIAVEHYKKEHKQEKVAFLSASWANPEVEVVEMPTV